MVAINAQVMQTDSNLVFERERYLCIQLVEAKLGSKRVSETLRPLI
jgi:hypothetical protein